MRKKTKKIKKSQEENIPKIFRCPLPYENALALMSRWTASKWYVMSNDLVISQNLFESKKHFQTILCLLLVINRSFHNL
ncbi:hypothetical protein [Enterococcus alcedinis]|uniref:hypothetical protein n=1 Tax=Enterococcus alcedinis TaxID=1274384 RepID=UPI001AE6AAC3|nr:hypothetical protein [Enterococcus alcedinis]MBP2102532.1 transcription elongation factor Elf1 [Enterococcus alcedinis]